MSHLNCYLTNEVRTKFDIYLALLQKWNHSINLVGKKTLENYFERHVIDCLQLAPIMNPQLSLLDVGSGAGFPGMILAIVGYKKVTLVESDERKCLFLTEVSRVLEVNVEILNSRVEHLSNAYDQVTSRAFGDLKKLLAVFRGVSRGTNSVGLFLKGESWQQEVDDAEAHGWKFNFKTAESLTNSSSSIIRVWGVEL